MRSAICFVRQLLAGSTAVTASISALLRAGRPDVVERTSASGASGHRCLVAGTCRSSDSLAEACPRLPDWCPKKSFLHPWWPYKPLRCDCSQ
uniref:Putative secreted protein n=1 Tax=Ixodes ricinus TaxID=34613 RepID=A0A6B0UH12_IXORI